MSLLDKLKALFGAGESGSARREERDVSATVERDPDRESGDTATGSTSGSAGENGDEPSAATTEPESPEPAAESDGSSEAASDSNAVEEDEADEDESEVPSEAVDVIKGIGPTYAGRLSEADVETVADLAEADPDDVADQADVPRGRVEDWIERARVRTR